MDFSWVTDEQEIEVNRARVFKDYSQLELASERIQLHERIFETKWFDYLDWKRENANRQILPARGKKRKLREEIPAGNEPKKASTGAWYEMSSSEDEEDASPDSSPRRESDCEPESKSESTHSKSTNIDVSVVTTEADSTTDIPCSSADITDYNLDDEEDDQSCSTSNPGGNISEMGKEISCGYDADDETELDEEIGW